MNFNYKVYHDLNNRQLNLGNILGPKFYEKKIIKSCFDSIDNLYLLEKKFYGTKVFCFSKDGDYLVEGETIWKIGDNFSFDVSCKIFIKPCLTMFSLGKEFNKDSSKFFISGYEMNKENEILVIDLLQGKSESLVKINYTITDISSSPSNSKIFTFGCVKGDIYLKDLRSSSIEMIKKDINNFRTLQYNPSKDNLVLITSINDNGLYVLDLRNHKSVMNYNILYNNKLNISNACYNKIGDQILLNRVNSNPLLFCSNNPYPICEFNDFGFFNNFDDLFLNSYQKVFKNSCFVGPDDEFIAVSSNNNKVYIWEIPQRKIIKESSGSFLKVNLAKFFLQHSSKVSYVEYNHERSILGCSTNTISFWSPFEFFLNINLKKEDNLSENSYFSKTFPQESIHLFHSSIGNFIDNCFILKNDENGLNKEYYIYDFQTFNDSYIDNFTVELNKDLNILYIKSFIQNYNETLKYMNCDLYKKIKDYNFNSKTVSSNDQYVSILIEIYKLYLTKNFIKKSIDYLDSQVIKILKLVNEISLSKSKFFNWNEQISSLKKIECILNLIKIDLELILLEDKNYVNSTELFEIFFQSYLEFKNFTNKVFRRNYSGKNFFKKEFNSDNKNVKKNLKISLDNYRKNLSSKMFDAELNENLPELLSRLKLKKEIKIEFVNKIHQKNY